METRIIGICETMCPPDEIALYVYMMFYLNEPNSIDVIFFVVGREKGCCIFLSEYNYQPVNTLLMNPK